MIDVEKLGVHKSMYEGTPSRDAQLRIDSVVHRLAGEPGRELMDGIRQGVYEPYMVPQELLDRTNSHFNNALAANFGLPGNMNMSRFWAQQEANANRVHTAIVRNFPSLGRAIEWASEIPTITGDITDTLEILAAHPGTKFGFEMRRRMLNGLVSTAIEADNMQFDISRELRKIEGVMQRHVFAKPDGRTNPLYIYARHDKSTNEVVEIDGALAPNNSDKTVVKRHAFNNREVPGYGKVYYAAREKDRDSSIIKALDRAYKNGGDLNPSIDVRDRYGLVMVGLENDTPAHLVEVVGNALDQYYKPVDREKTKEDNKTNGDYQGDIKMARTLFMFEGQQHDLPFEVMAFTAADFIDNQLRVGTKKKNGERDGIARPLFEVSRLKAALDLGYPSVHNGGYYLIDAQRAVNERQEDLVAGIRREGLMMKMTSVI